MFEYEKFFKEAKLGRRCIYSGEILSGKRYKNKFNDMGGYVTRNMYNTLKKKPTISSIFELSENSINEIISDLNNKENNTSIYNHYNISNTQTKVLSFLCL